MMSSLRARLFLSVGSILLIIAILSFFIPRIFIRKDINNASSFLSQNYDSYQIKIQQISKEWITARYERLALQLDALAHAIQIDKKSLREITAFVIGQDPEVSIVQATDGSHHFAVLSPESGQLYTPLWARDVEGQLWIKISPKEKIFLASKTTQNEGTTYLLFAHAEGEERAKTLEFVSFERQPYLALSDDTPGYAYDVLKTKENLLLEKMTMIQELIPWEGKASGILRIDSLFNHGVALLADEIFLTHPPIDASHFTPDPFVIYRKEGPYVDLVQFVPHTDSEPLVAIGYSLSVMGSEIARTLQKPMFLSYHGTLLQAFSPDGLNLPLSVFTVDPEQVTWKGEEYLLFNTQLGQISFTILISKAEKNAIFHFLYQVRKSIVAKISLNLLMMAGLLFIVALLFLARISKRITEPITQLALASEEIGKGNYTDLDLPPVEKRHDEVAILTHSFQKMVISLRDREKIRGVLNKVVSKEIANKILNSSIEVGGEERKLTMLFSDIRGFTALSEILAPQKLIGLLNTYMTRMCRIIDETHGVVDKFVGDEIMALYGAPLDMEKHEEKAIECALLMLADLERWNRERGEKEPQIKVGIGIHTGVAFAGNMGAEDRLNYTVVGANVNLAARLCSAADPMQILISEEMYQKVVGSHKFTIKKLPPVTLKGIDTPVPVYSILQ